MSRAETHSSSLNWHFALATLFRDPHPQARRWASTRSGSYRSRPQRPVPANPVARRHIDAALKSARLLNYRRADLPVFPFAPVDLRELEMCKTLHETPGRCLPGLIRQWQESDDYA